MPHQLLSAQVESASAGMRGVLSVPLAARGCLYLQVADILKGWGPSFKHHGCLARPGRKHMYYFIGNMMVLQPDPWHWFVYNSEPDHPMLPSGEDVLHCVCL